ncbi:hypothetical protein EBI01_11705 [Marinomonas rhizomae]|uniref:Uncharacterized protein n=1 Tax=Marinomonas rhizomae TaxID=491948 RepID=A0A366J8H7_9GAMM|nr:DUF5455 family protein [Marinomonas rhizomae]RBP83187.1 hypothetical protein DFP80_107165 [Marinomonas rhizomae]RNF72515.1 hypothetical protein EBI01_11705 [Marinomonas rhizomae]
MIAFLLPVISSVGSLLRLPALATFFATIFGNFIAFFAKWFTARTATQLGVIAAIASLTIGMIALIKTLISSISLVAPPLFSQAMSLVVPDNAPICISALVSAHTIKWVWQWQVRFIEYYSSGN